MPSHPLGCWPNFQLASVSKIPAGFVLLFRTLYTIYTSLTCLLMLHCLYWSNWPLTLFERNLKRRFPASLQDQHSDCRHRNSQTLRLVARWWRTCQPRVHFAHRRTSFHGDHQMWNLQRCHSRSAFTTFTVWQSDIFFSFSAMVDSKLPSSSLLVKPVKPKQDFSGWYQQYQSSWSNKQQSHRLKEAKKKPLIPLRTWKCHVAPAYEIFVS